MKQDTMKRRFSKVPGLDTGLMIGATVIPPLVKNARTAKQGGGGPVRGRVRVGIGKSVLPIPAFAFNQVLRAGIRRSGQKVRCFTPEKRRLHHFVVRELPGKGKALDLDFVAQALKMPQPDVSHLVDELEREKTFLCRKDSDAINWAYPVTVDDTPHRVAFSTGENINAA